MSTPKSDRLIPQHLPPEVGFPCAGNCENDDGGYKALPAAELRWWTGWIEHRKYGRVKVTDRGWYCDQCEDHLSYEELLKRKREGNAIDFAEWDGNTAPPEYGPTLAEWLDVLLPTDGPITRMLKAKEPA